MTASQLKTSGIPRLQDTQTVARSNRPQRSTSLHLVRTPLYNRVVASHRKRSASIPDVKAPPGHLLHPYSGLYRFSNTLSNTSEDQPRAPQNDAIVSHVQPAPQNEPVDSSSRQSVIDRHGPPSSSAVLPRGIATISKTDNIVEKPLAQSASKLNVVPNTRLPRVITMSSPHHHGLLTPATEFRPSACSITRNAPLKINPSKSRSGIGGTVASPSRLASPISPRDASNCVLPPKTSSVQSVRSAFALPFREINASVQMKDEGFTQREPRTPTHSRTVSGSSIRTAIRMPKMRDKDNQKARMARNDSIGSPKSFGRPLGTGRSMSVGSAKRNTGVGKAI